LSVSILTGCFMAAGAIGISAGMAMARHGQGTPLPSMGAKRLVVIGPYRHVRNPMATLSVLQGVCLGMLMQSGLVIVYSLLGGIAWEILVRPVEEAHLRAKFGQEFLD
jgi:protein-S-isoprenylcysteine O-methyltransferase Ste14